MSTRAAPRTAAAPAAAPRLAQVLAAGESVDGALLRRTAKAVKRSRAHMTRVELAREDGANDGESDGKAGKPRRELVDFGMYAAPYKEAYERAYRKALKERMLAN